VLVTSILFVLIIGVVITIIYNRPYFPVGWEVYKQKLVKEGEWCPYKYIVDNDTNYVYEVIWQEKYGYQKREYTRVIFRNKEGDYKLIAPWKEMEIVYSNINDIQFKVVPKIKMDIIYER
jgi:hypothetical protein